MSKSEILEELRRMPETERRELVAEIDSEFGSAEEELAPEEAAELDRRAEYALAHPESCRPISAVMAEIDKKLRSR